MLALKKPSHAQIGSKIVCRMEMLPLPSKHYLCTADAIQKSDDSPEPSLSDCLHQYAYSDRALLRQYVHGVQIGA